MIAEIADSQVEAAGDLLYRFFSEEGFVGDRELILANLDTLRNDAYHWAAVCIIDEQVVGVVTVTTMLYVEWGRLGEIGDLYVPPESRMKGIGSCFDRGCDRLVPLTRLLCRRGNDHPRGRGPS